MTREFWFCSACGQQNLHDEDWRCTQCHKAFDDTEDAIEIQEADEVQETLSYLARYEESQT